MSSTRNVAHLVHPVLAWEVIRANIEQSIEQAEPDPVWLDALCTRFVVLVERRLTPFSWLPHHDALIGPAGREDAPSADDLLKLFSDVFDEEFLPSMPTSTNR